MIEIIYFFQFLYYLYLNYPIIYKIGLVGIGLLYYDKFNKTSNTENLKSYECAICLEQCIENKNPPIGVLTQCGHRFHFECVKTWIMTGPRTTATLCPVCRGPLINSYNKRF